MKSLRGLIAGLGIAAACALVIAGDPDTYDLGVELLDPSDYSVDEIGPGARLGGNWLFRQLNPPDGQGNVFADMANAWGIVNLSYAGDLILQSTDPNPEGAQLVDYDMDGDLDYFSNIILYQNNLLRTGRGSGPPVPRFERLAPIESGLSTRWLDEGAAFADFDLDGDFDLFLQHNGRMAQIYLNAGDGTFTAVFSSRSPTPRYGARIEGAAEGLSIADWNCDGNPDAFTAGGGGRFRRNDLDPADQWPSFGLDAAIGQASFVPNLGLIAWADFDKDGDPDAAISEYVGGGAQDQMTVEGGVHVNQAYEPQSPAPHIRVRPVNRFDGLDDSANAYGAVAEIHLSSEPRTVRRRQFTASGHGYLNQSEYDLTFCFPPPAPATTVDISVDFPRMDSMETGIERIDRHVNSILGGYNDDYNEFIIYRDGTVEVVSDDEYAPDGDDPLLITAGGGLILPRDGHVHDWDANDPPPMLLAGRAVPSPTPRRAMIGIEFTTAAEGNPLRIRELIIDGQLAEADLCQSDSDQDRAMNVVLYEQVGGVWNRVDWLAGKTVPWNDRSFILCDFELSPGKAYRLMAKMDSYRETNRPDTGSLAHDDLTVTGGLFLQGLYPCVDANETGLGSADAGTLYLDFRYGIRNP